jgi:hypothetical protein
MYVNGKMISVETIPGMGGGEMKENGGGGEFKYDIFDLLYMPQCTPIQHNNLLKLLKINSI